MGKELSFAARVHVWCQEAVALWGYDWPQIEAHLRKRMDELSPSERAELAAEAQITLFDHLSRSGPPH